MSVPRMNANGIDVLPNYEAIDCPLLRKFRYKNEWETLFVRFVEQSAGNVCSGSDFSIKFLCYMP